jgi:predicted metal-dependent RNase
MIITYYGAGLVSGISVASFFIGKELYRYYISNKVQKKQLDRLEKLNDKIKKSFELQAH